MKKFIKETSKKIATGALAILATIGSANIGVFAGNNTPTGSTEITGHSGGSTSTAWTSGDELDLNEIGTDQTGTIPVKGYQTAKAYNYEIKVSWGDMKFIFDRGKYDPNTNQLTKKVTNDAWAYCEAGVKSDGSAASAGEGVGKWCGFDGKNNRVDVENLGNGNINMIASCTEGLSGTQTLGSGVDMQIGVLNSELSESSTSTYDNWTMSGTQASYTMPCDDSHTAAMSFATGENKAASAIIQKKYDLGGSILAGEVDTSTGQSHANQVRFYLNITGTPEAGVNTSYLDTLSTTPPSADNGGWEQIGTINLSFRGVAEASTPSLSASMGS